MTGQSYGQIFGASAGRQPMQRASCPIHSGYQVTDIDAADVDV
jgi:hypothetical protein